MSKLVVSTCRWCGANLIQHSVTKGRGTWWSSPTPNLPNGGTNQRCSRDGPKHQPDLPDLTDEVEVEAWLDGVREGLDA